MADHIKPHRKNIKFNIGDIMFLGNRNNETTRPSTKLINKKDGQFKIINIFGSA